MFHVEQWVDDVRYGALVDPVHDLIDGAAIVAFGLLAFWAYLA